MYAFLFFGLRILVLFSDVSVFLRVVGRLLINALLF